MEANYKRKKGTPPKPIHLTTEIIVSEIEDSILAYVFDIKYKITGAL